MCGADGFIRGGGDGRAGVRRGRGRRGRGRRGQVFEDAGALDKVRAPRAQGMRV